MADHYHRDRTRRVGEVTEVTSVSSSYTVDEVPPDVLARAERSRIDEDDPQSRRRRQERLERLAAAAAAARLPESDAALLVYRVSDTQVVIDALDRISGRTDDGPRSDRTAAVDALVTALGTTRLDDQTLDEVLAEYRYLLNGA